MRVLDVANSEQGKARVGQRRAKLVALALLFILLSLAAFSLIALFPRTLAALSEIVVGYPKYVRLTNAGLSLICAAFLLWPREGGQLVGRWNYYVGLAFLTFFVQYGWRFFALLVTPSDFEYFDLVIKASTAIVVYFGSFLNNLFLLAAARILLNKNKRNPSVPPPTADAGLYGQLKYQYHALKAALPNWSLTWFIIILLLSSLPLFEESYYPSLIWVRFFDAFFSIFCLSWFAYAIWLGLRVRRYPVLAWLGFILVLGYGSGQLVYAVNPLFGYSVARHARPSYGPLKLMSERLEPAVAKVVNEKGVTATDVFDGAIFAMLFPMKYLLFLPAFILYLLSIIFVNDFRQALRDTTSKRKDYLSGDGILSVIGRSMEADEVQLLIRIPGQKRRQGIKEERVLAEVWRAPGVPEDEEEQRIFPVKQDRLLIRVMQTEGEVIVKTNEDDDEDAAELRKIGPSPQTLALIPIKFHGGVIGALRVVFRGYGKYNDGTLEQLKFMAELIAPAVQDFRTVSAIDKLGPRLNRIQGIKPTDSFKKATEKMVEMLFDLLNPLGVGLLIEFGFTSLKPIYPREGDIYEILKGRRVSYKEMTTTTFETERGPVKVKHDQLSVTIDKGATHYRHHLGNLILAIPEDRDDFDKPTLAAHYLTRRMLASLIANGISNAARNSLNVVIQDLAVALNKETLSTEEWFNKIRAAIEKTGLLWVVVSEGEGQPLRGEPEHVELVEGLAPEDRDILLSEALTCVPHRGHDSATRHVIHLKLQESGCRIWLGVEREEFGRELNFRSPWKVFLENLANVAGTAFARIAEREEAEARRRKEEEQRLRAARDEWLKTIADITAILMHQLVNMVKNLLSVAEEVLESASNDPVAPNGQLVASTRKMKKSGEMMLELTTAYNKIIEMDGHRYCYVGNAARQAQRLFQFALSKLGIEVHIAARPDAVAKVPPNVVAIFLASLIGNAIDAIKSKGKTEDGMIDITARVENDFVVCHVVNNGPEIPEEIRSQLFQPVRKGKGWGLYLVSRSLENYGGEVFLSYSNPQATCFTIRLPLSKNSNGSQMGATRP